MNSFDNNMMLFCDIYKQVEKMDIDEEVMKLFELQVIDAVNDYGVNEYVRCRIDSILNELFNVLSEKDFCPPEDKRILRSRLHDVNETNNFNQFTKEYFELCDEEEIYD